MNFVAIRPVIRWTLIVTNTILGSISAVLHSLSNIVTVIINEAHGVLTNIYMNSLVLVAPLPGSYTVFTTLVKVTNDYIYASIIAIVIELSLGGLSYLVIASILMFKGTDKEWAMKTLMSIWGVLICVIFAFVIAVDIEGEIYPLRSILLLMLPVLLLPAISISSLLKIHKKALTFNDAFPGENLNSKEVKVKLSDIQMSILNALLNSPLSKSEIALATKVDVVKILNKAGRGPLADLMTGGYVQRIGEGVKTKYELLELGKITAMQE